jgi:urease accessory protein
MTTDIHTAMGTTTTMASTGSARGNSSPLPAGGERDNAASVQNSSADNLSARNPAKQDSLARVSSSNLDALALYKLMAWFSPSYPIGAFSYSSGLEWAVEAGDISDAGTLLDWLKVLMGDGAGFCDGVFFSHAWRACTTSNDDALRMVIELAAALAPSRERFLETTMQGRAFLDATRAAWPCAALDRLAAMGEDALAYPVVAGAATAGHDIPLRPALSAYLQALVANWVSAGMRLIPLGQTDGQRVIAALEPIVAATAERALAAALDDAGSAAFRADLASMRHETQYTRLFRS